MVRALDSALIAALNSHTRRPALKLTLEDHVVHYGAYQTPGTADAWNDACIANDNGIVRVQLTRGGSGFVSSFQVQRITDPTQTAQWSSWSTLPGASGTMFQDGGCAVSNSNGTLNAFAQHGTGGNALWSWTSTNNGVSWNGPFVVLTLPGSALLKGIGSAGRNDVFFLYDVSGGEAMGCSFYNGSSWSSLTTWTLPPVSAGAGVAVAWAGSTYTLVYSDGYSLFSCTYTPGTNVWMGNGAIAPATSTAIGRIAPRLSFFDGVYALICVEADAGLLTGTVYSYPRLRQSVDLVHWSNGFIVHDLSVSYGVTIFKVTTPVSGNAGPRYYLAALPAVYSAQAFQMTNAAQYLDVSASVLSYQRHEQAGKATRCEVTLDNAGGAYNALLSSIGTNAPLGLNASLLLSEGYLTGSPPTVSDVVKVGTYHLVQIQVVRSPQENKLVLIGLDVSRNLDVVARYQNSYANQTLGYLVTEICARAGLFAVVLPTTTQVSQVIPMFVVQAGLTYRHALDELCSIYGLSYFLDQDETLQFRELSPSDGVVWSYQPEVEMVSFGGIDQRANHIIVTGKPPVGGQPGALTTAEAYDDVHLHLVGVERLLYHVDPKLTNSIQCSQKASFLLAQAVRSQLQHHLTVPLNPALQLLDVLSITDSIAPIGSGQYVTGHIVSLAGKYDAHSGLNELFLTLEG